MLTAYVILQNCKNDERQMVFGIAKKKNKNRSQKRYAHYHGFLQKTNKKQNKTKKQK